MSDEELDQLVPLLSLEIVEGCGSINAPDIATCYIFGTDIETVSMTQRKVINFTGWSTEEDALRYGESKSCS